MPNKYKLFEIDWRIQGPFVTVFLKENEGRMDVRLSCSMTEARLGACAEGYRIFGFTNDENWSDQYESASENGAKCPWPPYHNCSCDHTGNYKYAIGRLEE